jgi:hypothetical protein
MAAYVFLSVGNIINATWFEKDAEASPVATSTPEAIVSNPEFPDFPPALVTICTAESGGKHEVNGKIVHGHVNPNDIGICQINQTIWGDKAYELGYEIRDVEGNKKMAKWLFYRYGTQPWNSSKHIWEKKIMQN